MLVKLYHNLFWKATAFIVSWPSLIGLTQSQGTIIGQFLIHASYFDYLLQGVLIDFFFYQSTNCVSIC
jgi:hypothetical protein